MFEAHELAIQLTGFRNVDLFSQGIYQLRFSACGLRSGRKAVPLCVLDSEVPGGVHERLESHDKILLPAHTLDDAGEVCSPAFRIRYCEEEVHL